MNSGKMISGRLASARKKRINDYLKIAMFATAAAITTTFQWGCVREDYNGSSGATVGDDVEVMIMMNVPSVASSTRAMSKKQENSIDYLNVLVFLDPRDGSDETYLYTTYATDYLASDDGSTSTVKVGFRKNVFGEYHRFVFIANMKDRIAELQGSWDETMTKAEVLETLTFDAYAATASTEPERVWDTATPRYLPMWGETADSYVVTSTLMGSTLGTIKMLRSVATVDIVLNPDVDGSPLGFGSGVFELQDIKVYNVPQRGYAAPDPDNITGMVADLPTYSTSFTRDAATVVAYETDQTADEHLYGISRMVYIPEAPNTDGAGTNIDDLDQTCLVISGYYDGSPDLSWYRLDFINKLSATENIRFDILRNHRYTFYITAVEGPGYPDEETAFKSAPLNLDTEVLVWDDYEMEDVWVDGQYFYSLSPMKREHWAAISTGNVLRYKSNYPTWTFEISDNPTPGAGTKPSWINVTSDTEGAVINGDPAGLDIEYDVAQNSDGVTRTAYIHLKTGRWIITAQIDQTPWYITDVTINPIGDITAAQQDRVITARGLFDDIKVRVWDMTDDVEITNGVILSNSPGGASSNATVSIPAFYNGLTVASDRTLAFEFFHDMHGEWRPLQVDKQEAYYVATANRTGNNITGNGGGLTITLTGNIPPNTYGRVVLSNNYNSVVSTNSTTVVGNQMTLSRNTSGAQRSLMAQYLWRGAWVNAGAAFNQPVGPVLWGGVYTYPQTFTGMNTSQPTCPSGYRLPRQSEAYAWVYTYNVLNPTVCVPCSDLAYPNYLRLYGGGGSEVLGYSYIALTWRCVLQ